MRFFARTYSAHSSRDGSPWVRARFASSAARTFAAARIFSGSSSGQGLRRTGSSVSQDVQTRSARRRSRCVRGFFGGGAGPSSMRDRSSTTGLRGHQIFEPTSLCA